MTNRALRFHRKPSRNFWALALKSALKPALAAVRGLKQMRTVESVAALSKVLTVEKTRDPAMADRAHEGLVALTGQNLPSDPQKWDAMVRGGQTPVVPPPSERTAGLDQENELLGMIEKMRPKLIT